MMTPAPPSSPHQTSRQRELHPVLSAALSSLDMDLDAELARYQLAQQSVSSSSETDAALSPAIADPGTARSLPTVTATSEVVANPFSGIIPDYADPGVTSVQTQRSEADQDSAAPETYLASSEELLRSLDEDTEAESVDAGAPGWQLSNMLTPLGVGLMLLVGLSSLTAATVLLNARSVRLSQQTDSEPVATSDEASTTLSPLSPDLTLGEFTRLNLSRLSTLPPWTNRSNRSLLEPQPEPDAANEDAAIGEILRPNAEESAVQSPLLAPLPAQTSPLPAIPLRSILPQPRPAPQAAPKPRPVQPAAPAPIAPEPITATPPEVVAPPAAADTASNQSDRNAADSTNPLDNTESRSEPSRSRTSQSSSSQPNAPRTNPAQGSSQPSPSQSSSAQSNPAQPSRTQPNASRSVGQEPTAPAAGTPPAPSRPEPTDSRATPTPAEPEASAGDYHRVVAPYTGDRSLEQAREAVSGAYLNNSSEGAQVRLGAFESESSAQQLVDQLTEQGIPATVQSE